MSTAPKKGFEPLFRTSPFLDYNGPFYQKKSSPQLIVGLRILEKHVNGRGYAHAGILMTLSDIATGYCTAFSEQSPLNIVTTSLSTNFLQSVKLGDWLEAHVSIIKKGKRLVNATCQILKDEDLVVQSNASYRVIKGESTP